MDALYRLTGDFSGPLASPGWRGCGLAVRDVMEDADDAVLLLHQHKTDNFFSK